MIISSLGRNFNPLPRKRENAETFRREVSKKDFNPLPRKRENVIKNVIRWKFNDFNPLPRKRENYYPMLFV